MSAVPPSEAQRVQQRRAFGFIVMSAVMPGSVQGFAGNRRIGHIAMRTYGVALALVLLAGFGLLVARGFTAGILLTPWIGILARTVLWVLFIGWVLLLLDAWRLARPMRLAQRGRLALTITTGLLVLALGSVTAVAANALTGAANVGEVFKGGGDVTAKKGRYNILLLGADASESREGLRPDSISVASIDVDTGRTVLFGLPRNMQRVRFPDSSPLHALYRDGFVCDEGACMLNGIWTLGEDHKDLYKGKDAGLEATKEAVSETLGLDINYYAMVDMAGFSSLIDAMGGIKLDISKPIPIGGVSSKISGYIEPGKGVQLDGYHALWFARSRAESNDYERMVRQKCVMAAMVKQLDPVTVATKFVELSEASKSILRTDVPRGEVTNLAELALKAKGQKIASVNFAPPMIVSAKPDFNLIRSTVKAKIEESEKLDSQQPPAATQEPSPAASSPEPQTSSPAAEPSGSSSATASKAPSPGSGSAGSDTAPYTETQDLDAVCSVSA